MKKINYTGSSTIIKRLCEIVNELVDGGGSAVTSVNTKTGDVVLTTSDLQNDSGYITNVVNDLTNYYLKSETYTKAEVNNLIGTFVDIRVVSSLPTSDISRTTIYLVPKSVAQTNNLYDEYINLDGTSQGWEKIGDTQIDLSNYIQKSQTSGLIKNDGTIDTNTYVTDGALTILLSDYYTSSQVDTLLESKVNTDDAWATKNTTVISATSENPVDLNDYRTPGNYSSADSSVSQYIVNAPTTSAGFNLIVMRLANFNSRIRQIAIINGATAIYTRYYASNTWSSWVNIAKDTTYSAMSQSELVTGTATTLRTERADYLNAAIRELIRSYGWGTQGAQAITGTSEAHEDLNTYTTPGNYTCTSNANAAYVDNKPTGSTNKAFNLIVIKTLNSNSYIRQVAWLYDSVNFYIRLSKDGGSTWESWNALSPNNIPSAFCVTSASTAAKTASCTYFHLRASNQYVHVLMRYTNTYQGAITLNINGTGAKPIYINGVASSSTNYDLKAGTYLVFYDGTNYYFRTDNKLPADIDGSADYLRGMNTSSVSSITNSPGDYKANIENIVSSATTGLFPAADNSNAILQVNRMNGNYDSQLGFSSNGELYYRSFNNEALNTTKYWGRLIKEYTFTKTLNHYAYFYFSLPSSGQITLEIDGTYYYSANKTIVGMSVNNGSWPLLEPTTTTWGDGAATKAWIGKTNNVPWIAVDTQGSILNVRLYAQSSEGASIIDFQSNTTDPTSASDEYSGTYKTPTSSELYPDSPKVVHNKSSDTFLYSYDIKRVFLQVSYRGTWTLNQSKDITAQFKNVIGDKLIRIISHSISVYDVESNNEKYNICGNFELHYFYNVNTIHEVVITNRYASLIGGTGSYVTILLEYIEL